MYYDHIRNTDEAVKREVATKYLSVGFVVVVVGIIGILF